MRCCVALRINVLPATYFFEISLAYENQIVLQSYYVSYAIFRTREPVMSPTRRPLTVSFDKPAIIRGKDYWNDIHKTECSRVEADGEPCGGVILIMTRIEDYVTPKSAYCLRCGQHYVPDGHEEIDS